MKFNVRQILEFFQIHNSGNIIISELGFGDEGGYKYQEFNMLVFDNIKEFYQYFYNMTGYGWTCKEDDECYAKGDVIVSLSQLHIVNLTLTVYTYKNSGFYFTFNNPEIFNEVLNYIRQNDINIRQNDITVTAETNACAELPSVPDNMFTCSKSPLEGEFMSGWNTDSTF